MNNSKTLSKQKIFFELAQNRKTTYEFHNKKIANRSLKKILEAGRWAPSCSNTQPWHFIVVKNPKRIEELMKTASYGAFHSDPSLIIALVLDTKCWESADHRCVKDAKLGIYEAYICIGQPALNMVFEAEELGIATALLTPKQTDAAAILKIRAGDVVPLLVAFGYEKKGSFQKPHKRKKLSEITSAEYFGGKLSL